MAGKVTKFEIKIPCEDVKRLSRKLADTRLPQHEVVPGAGSAYGPSIEWFHRLYNRWVGDFRWEAVEEHLNRHEHFLMDVSDGVHELQIHFAHTRSVRPDAIPIILVHGWPGSFYEFDRVVDAFANPENPDYPAFHVVVPSLPGFCWSSGPPGPGWTLQDTARVFNSLMKNLGYHSYVVQAGDWGSFVAREMGSKFVECKAVHLNFCPVEIPRDARDLTERETTIRDRYSAWLDDHLGYAMCMRTRPHTIGVALTDNPVGILSWVGEKFEEAAAPESQKDRSWDDAILITTTLYYFTNCILSSMLPYYENVKHAEFGAYFLKEENYIRVPMGYTSFLWDTRPGTKRMAQLTGNLQFYNECDTGGHFAALERPEVVLADCRKFFGGLSELK